MSLTPGFDLLDSFFFIYVSKFYFIFFRINNNESCFYFLRIQKNIFIKFCAGIFKRKYKNSSNKQKYFSFPQQGCHFEKRILSKIYYEQFNLFRNFIVKFR